MVPVPGGFRQAPVQALQKVNGLRRWWFGAPVPWKFHGWFFSVKGWLAGEAKSPPVCRTHSFGE
jgi:hypothetical protein